MQSSMEKPSFYLIFAQPKEQDLWLNWIKHCTTDAAIVGSNPSRFTMLLLVNNSKSYR